MKKWNQKGFTLAELLIVVAIIAVLVAISIPIFNQQLEKSRENTDIANLRAAKAAAVSAYLTEDSNLGLDTFTATNKYVVLVYDASAGVLKSPATETAIKSMGVKAYGKGTSTQGGCAEYEMRPTINYTQDSVAAGGVIVVQIDSGGNLKMGWEIVKDNDNTIPLKGAAATEFTFH